MFENLTPREQILAKLILALVPMTLLFVAVFWFVGRYNDNNMSIVRLADQIAVEEGKMLAAKKADLRRDYYRSVSLPSNIVNASNDYQAWLKKLVRDDLKMDFKSLTPRDVADLKFKTKVVGKSKSFTLLASGDLKQLAEFLHKFYSVDLLHRISSLKIVPVSVGSENGKKVRTGKLSLIISVEAVSLVDADIDRDFASSYRELAHSGEEYQLAILRRNIFGPANNTPSISARPSASYTSDTEIKIGVSADDADENDVLNFELVESSVAGAKLVQSEGGERKASLEIPGQKAGEYTFKLVVRDSGFPAKQNEELIKVTFKDRVVAAPPTPPPVKPKFIHAKETRITGIVKDSTDQWLVWIKVRTTGERFQLKTGESFNLDEKTWTVHAIEPGQAIIQVDNQLLTFRPTDPFDAPRTTEVIATSKDAEVETKVESGVEPKNSPQIESSS